MKKLDLKEIIFKKNQSEKRGRTIGNLVRIKKKLNYPKRGDQNTKANMNDLIIGNDFHGSKIINFEENWKKRFDKLNILVKYQQKIHLNKRSSNNYELEKNQSINTTSINKKKKFRNFQNISKINSPKKISKTINDINNTSNNIESKNNNLHTINIRKYIPKRIRYKNDDIINLLNDSNN